MFTMKTWKERFPLESMLPDDLIGRYNKEVTSVFRFVDPSSGVQSQLRAIGRVGQEGDNRARRPDLTPVPSLRRSGYAYSEWSKRYLIRSTVKKIATGLSIRVSRKGPQPGQVSA
jgi:hypothetical protein